MTDIFFRDFRIRSEDLEPESRKVSLIFSTEKPARRWLGDEYLLHGEENVDLSRLESVGSGLLNHDPSKIVGPISDIGIMDFTGVATLEFDDDEIGNNALGKVRSGSLRGVSVGYSIDDAVRIFDDETYDIRNGFTVSGPAVIAKRWTPYEITLTPIPLDTGAHVDRAVRQAFENSCRTIKKVRLGLPPDSIWMKKLEMHGRYAKCQT